MRWKTTDKGEEIKRVGRIPSSILLTTDMAAFKFPFRRYAPPTSIHLSLSASAALRRLITACGSSSRESKSILMFWPQSDITNDARIGGAPDGINDDECGRPLALALAAELPRFTGMGDGGGESRAGGGVRERPRSNPPLPSISLPVGRRVEREMCGNPEGPGMLAEGEGAYSESKARSVCMACFKSLTRLAARWPFSEVSFGGWPVGVRGLAEFECEEEGEVGLGVVYRGVRSAEDVVVGGRSPKGPRATALNTSSSCCGARANGFTITSLVDKAMAPAASASDAYTTK